MYFVATKTGFLRKVRFNRYTDRVNYWSTAIDIRLAEPFIKYDHAESAAIEFLRDHSSKYYAVLSNNG